MYPNDTLISTRARTTELPRLPPYRRLPGWRLHMSVGHHFTRGAFGTRRVVRPPVRVVGRSRLWLSLSVHWRVVTPSASRLALLRPLRPPQPAHEHAHPILRHRCAPGAGARTQRSNGTSRRQKRSRHVIVKGRYEICALSMAIVPSCAS